MKRYWFNFEIEDGKSSEYPAGVILGCGVTAFSYQDAINILREKVFTGGEMPKIRKVIEDVNINDLDQDHIIPNMRPPIYRGVWFPQID
jgi:hypothetical protein